MNGRRPKGQHIGKAAGIVRAFLESENACHEDVAAWGAPSECHSLVSRGEARRFRSVRRHVKAITGLPWRAYVREVKARTTQKWDWINNATYEPPAHGGPRGRYVP